ncbi:MAG TPA: xanthine dehydrogenase family protein molybdopterin-binding subunit [Methylomirabilota bacterium]|nr:xanthine dehydrogenase family protein molybdopterin-binding subunit [Methylomirabilota bacterium]
MIGASPRRKEDHRLITGAGRYVDDVHLPGTLHAALVRSPHAHARVVRIDARRARRRSGVIAVLTVREAPELAGSVPPLIKEAQWPAYVHPVMAGERVRHVGEAVAVIVADDAYGAADAVEAVAVEYAPLPVAAAPVVPAPALVHEGWRDNRAGRQEAGTGDVARGLAEAELVVEAHLVYPRVTGVPIEGRGVLAAPDRGSGRLTIWSSTQVPFNVRAAVASALGVPEATIRVIAPDVGGGFGIKGHVYPEDVLVPAVARRLGRPVKWVETRREHFLTASGDRDQTHTARLGVRRDGAITALETTFTRDHGAFPTLGGAMTANTINHLVGPYRVPSYRARGDDILTHKSFGAAYRGAGRPEAALVLDRLLDRAARGLGMDPAELRRRNLIRREDMPYRTGLTYRDGVAITYDPADYVAAFDALLARLDYTAWRKEQAARRGGARPLGLGISAYVEGTGIGPFEGADVSVDPGGVVFVDVGVGAQGQAHETTLAQIAAAELGVPLERVIVRGGDTDRVGFGMGTIASRVAAVAGPAIARSAREVARKARLVAAEMFECAADDVVVAEGHVWVAGAPGRRLTLGQVARAAVRSRALVETGRPGLGACVFFYPGSVTWAFGAQAAVVEVDLDTCAPRVVRHAVVHDAGRSINPMVVEGQVHGGTAQGLGSALLEEVVHDDQGQLLTGSLMDYALPRAADFPALEIVHVEFPSAVNELGIKGVGESGVISPGAIVAGAVEDALADYGVQIDRLPVTSGRVFEALCATGRWPRRR